MTRSETKKSLKTECDVNGKMNDTILALSGRRAYLPKVRRLLLQGKVAVLFYALSFGLSCGSNFFHLHLQW